MQNLSLCGDEIKKVRQLSFVSTFYYNTPPLNRHFLPPFNFHSFLKLYVYFLRIPIHFCYIFELFLYYAQILDRIIIGDYIMKTINEILRDFREDHDFSQLEVSKFLNIPRSTYGRYEARKQ